MDDARHVDAAKIVTSRMALLALTAELCAIYAKDESEKANIAAIDALQHAFKASSAAIYYLNGHNEYRICIAGTDFPIAIPETRWRASVAMHSSDSSVSRFDNWSLPGLERELPAWISAQLYLYESEGGYVFLGREQGEWTDSELSSLASIKEAIAPIVSIRHERGIEEKRRVDAELSLAKNERRLRDFFEDSRDVIYTTGSDDIITSINRMALKLLGLNSKDELIGKPLDTFILVPADRVSFMKRLLADGFVDDFEIVLKRSNGEAVFCIETAHALKDENGRIVEVQGIIKDLSDRIRGEKELWKSNLELAETNLKLQKTQAAMVQQEKLASIGQLAAGVAHEINNPLGFILSNNATLERYFSRIKTSCGTVMKSLIPSQPESKESIALERLFGESETIFAETRDGLERIVKIVSSLKDFSQINTRGGHDAYNLNAGLESTLVVAMNSIKYVAEVKKTLASLPSIHANGGEINQVFLNILVNAAQAIQGQNRTGRGLIELETRQEGENVVVTIRDDGPGIPKEAISKVFDPFFTTKAPGKGTGLGLSISYNIVVNKHGGSFWVESEPGEGTRFYIVLPIAAPDSVKSGV